MKLVLTLTILVPNVERGTISTNTCLQTCERALVVWEGWYKQKDSANVLNHWHILILILIVYYQIEHISNQTRDRSLSLLCSHSSTLCERSLCSIIYQLLWCTTLHSLFSVFPKELKLKMFWLIMLSVFCAVFYLVAKRLSLAETFFSTEWTKCQCFPVTSSQRLQKRNTTKLII